MGLFGGKKDTSNQEKKVKEKKPKPEKSLKKKGSSRKDKNTTLKKNGTYVAIEFGTKNLKVASGGLRNDKIQIDEMYNIQLDDQLSKKGLLESAKEYGKILKDSLENYKIKTKDCIVTIESDEIIKREMVIPQMPHEDALSLVRYEMERYLSINAEDFVIQYKVLDEVIEDGQGKWNVMVGALPKAMTDTYYEMIRDIGLNPMVLDMSSNVIQNLFLNNKETIFLVDIGYNNINTIFIERGKYKFNRILKTGGVNVERDIARNCNISEKEAQEWHEMLKSENINELGKMYDRDFENFQSLPQKEKAYISYIRGLNGWIGEIDKVLRYYTTRSVGNTVDRVYLYGGEAFFKGIDEFIGDKLRKPTSILNYSDEVVFPGANRMKELPFYLNVISSLGRQ